jgi:hypothetical protein
MSTANKLIVGVLVHTIGKLKEAIKADQSDIEQGDEILTYLNDIKWEAEPGNVKFTIRSLQSPLLINGELLNLIDS